jgi:hypothetical protein
MERFYVHELAVKQISRGQYQKPVEFVQFQSQRHIGQNTTGERTVKSAFVERTWVHQDMGLRTDKWTLTHLLKHPAAGVVDNNVRAEQAFLDVFDLPVDKRQVFVHIYGNHHSCPFHFPNKKICRYAFKFFRYDPSFQARPKFFRYDPSFSIIYLK